MPSIIPGKWKWLVFLFLIAGVYFSSRLTNLTKLPIFTDEAIYIRWSQIGAHDANWRFISLVDGKQPMFTWVMMVFLRILPQVDPLFVGRLVSVVMGAVNITGLWLLSWELFKNRRISMFTSVLYLVSPFAVMYDRLALYDGMVATFYIWNLYLAILLVRRIRLDIALLLGLALGAGMLNKTSGFISLYLLPTTLFLYEGRSKRRIIGWIGFVFLAGIMSVCVYSILRLSPLFHMIARKDTIFVYPLGEWVTQPTRFLFGNLRGLSDWLVSYLTAPVFFASLMPLFFGFKRLKSTLLLYSWWFIPFVGLALFGRVLYPRFIFFMTMPLLVLASVSIEWFIATMRNRLLKIFVLTIVFIQAAYISLLVIVNPLNAPIPFSDRGQLIDDWPSGGGVREVTEYLYSESTKGKITVYTEGTFGLMPYAIEIYLVDKPNIDIHGIWPLPTEIPMEMLLSAQDHSTYLVLNESQAPPASWPLELILTYQKGTRQDRALRLYRVTSSIAGVYTISPLVKL